MFHRNIEALGPWTDRGMFENVTGGKYRSPTGGGEDIVMQATLRAVLSRRLPADIVFVAKPIAIGVDDENIENPVSLLNSASCVATNGECEGINDLRNKLYVMYVENIDDERLERFVNNSKDKVLEMDGWSIHEKQHNYLNQHMKMVALLNQEHNVCIIVTKRPSIDHWHLLCSMIPAYFSQLFKDIPLEQSEKEMLHALTMHGSQTWVSKMAMLEDFYDIRAKKIEQMIGGFELREREAQLSTIDNEINNLGNQMEQNLRQYRDLCARKDEANIRRNGLLYTIEHTGDEDELVKFFIANKSLDVQEVRGTRITFVIRTKYENFGSEAEEVYESCKDNARFWEENAPRSSESPFASVEARKKFIDALILDRRFKMLLCGVYTIDVTGYARTHSGYDFPANCADYMRNYHLDHHECMGGYEPIIRDYLQRGDTMGAINACITSVTCINVSETGATFNPFMKTVWSSSQKCIELPDGTRVTPAKALEWLNEQEGNENE